MQDKRASDAYNTYFRFNNKRTLSTMLPSELSIIESLNLKAYIDKTRRYDNQILIHHHCDLAYLDSVYGLFDLDALPEIAIESGLETPELKQWLNERGYQPSHQHEFLSLNRFGLDLSHVSQSNVHVERWTEARADDFLALLKTSGLTCSDQVWKSKKSFYCTESFRVYVAYLDGIPCAWATSYLENNLAILGNAFTQEHARGKGCQTELLTTRVQDAIDLGAERVLTDVLSGSVSQKNCRRIGFQPDVVRQVWLRR